MNGALTGALWLVGLYWTLMFVVSIYDIGKKPHGVPVKFMWEKIAGLTIMFSIVGGFWGWVLS